MNSNGHQSRPIYFRSLDGLRGVSILLVLLVHGGVLPPGGSYGFMAVNAFFVLSGFLITYLLVLEYDKSNGINLQQFYIRRALRLLPALVAMLFAFMIFAFIAHPPDVAFQDAQAAKWALFYSTNLAEILHIYPSSCFYLLHTWSLSIEEQFYFLWPMLLFLLLRKQSRISLLHWILLGALLSVCLRAALFLGTSDATLNPNRLGAGPDTRADSLLLGCFVGVLISSKLFSQSRWSPKISSTFAIMSGIGLILLGYFQELAPWMICVGWLLDSIFAAIIIAHLVSNPPSLLHQIFERSILVYVGRISYGLYIWHYPILIFMQRHRLPWRHLMYLPPVFVAVLASYYFIERPCLRLKSRFAQIKLSGVHQPSSIAQHS